MSQLNGQSVTDLVGRLSEIEKERQQLGFQLVRLLNLGEFVSAAPTTTHLPSASAKQPRKKREQKVATEPAAPRRKRTMKAKGKDGVVREQPSMKNIVFDFVQKHPGATLNDATTHVTGLIAQDKYVTKTKNLGAIVSQAISQLVSDKVISGEKRASDKGRSTNAYTVVQAEPAPEPVVPAAPAAVASAAAPAAVTA